MGRMYLVDGDLLEQELTDVADAIRAASGGEAELAFPQGFSEAIRGLSAGGGGQDLLALRITNRLTEYQSDITEDLAISAFEGASSLARISLPNVKTAGNYAFGGCTSLTDVDMPSLERASAFLFNGCTGLKRLVLPGVKNIGPSSCVGCTSLEYVDLGSPAVAYPNSFKNCTALTTLIIRSDRVVGGGTADAFQNSAISQGLGYVYVPASQVENYKTAQHWSNFASQYRAIEDYPEICGGEV